ncbi:hypothetical protein ACFLY6_02505, partial [Candidatus Dependentiae bacterium]
MSLASRFAISSCYGNEPLGIYICRKLRGQNFKLSFPIVIPKLRLLLRPAGWTAIWDLNLSSIKM